MSSTFRYGIQITGDASGLEPSAGEANAALRAMGVSSMAEYRRMAQARETLGIRPEREIQREIYRTEAAYNRLARSGAMSWREQARAARAMREEVTRLTNE